MANFCYNYNALSFRLVDFGGAVIKAICYFYTRNKFHTPRRKISIIPVTKKTKLLFPKNSVNFGDIVIIHANLIMKLPNIIK